MGKVKQTEEPHSAATFTALEKAVEEFRSVLESSIMAIRKAGEEYARKRCEILSAEKEEDVDSFEDEKLIRADEAAKFIGYKRGTLYHMTMRQEIPFEKRGHAIFFRKKDLKAWMNGKFGKPIVKMGHQDVN